MADISHSFENLVPPAPEYFESLLQQSSGDPKADIYLLLGDAYADQGRLSEASLAYSQGLQLSSHAVPPARLDKFVSALIELTRANCSMEVKARDYDDIFCCPSCRMFFSDPVTVDCGHTFCKVCLEEVECCLKCETNITRLRTATLGVNVLMVRILEKWFPEETELSKMKENGSKLVATNCHKEAIELFSNALLKAPKDVFLRNCRSKVLSTSGQFQKALLDAEFLTTHQPNYIQGYHRKAEALHGLSRFDESMTAYLQGLAQNPRTSSTRTNLTKVVHQILSPQAEELKSPNDLCQSAAHAQNQSISKSLQCLGVQSNLMEGCSSLKSKKGIECTSGNSENIADSAQNNRGSLENSDERSNRVVPRNLISPEDFECILCLRLLLNPVTTPCGHVFCCGCLYRSLDHRPTCPLCKESLAEFLAERRQATTEVVHQMIELYFQEELLKRRQEHEQELVRLSGASNDQEMPIFVCTMAYPSIPCPLHVYEPRYRLMIRRCIESGTRTFGMCTLSEGPEENFSEYGTALEILDVQYTPDGRCILNTVGRRRFHVTTRGICDGYRTAKVQYLTDSPVASENVPEVTSLLSDVFMDAQSWFTSLPHTAQQRIAQCYGNFPQFEPLNAFSSTDGPNWVWFITSILPIDSHAQLDILAMTSLKERLVAVRRVIAFVRQHRWPT